MIRAERASAPLCTQASESSHEQALLLFALSIALSGPAFAATDDELQKALVGTWGDSADCTTGILVFNSDGSFSSGSGSDPGDVQRGTYTVSGGKLNGKAERP